MIGPAAEPGSRSSRAGIERITGDEEPLEEVSGRRKMPARQAAELLGNAGGGIVNAGAGVGW
ncbi:hypothetical protein [Kitasatospora sp. NPDC088346]|uniref:hypothetical protein n=1 Tax=Kitasatospora sp. NPDC088346 TaxID=3364073 RepID=UPI00381289B1